MKLRNVLAYGLLAVPGVAQTPANLPVPMKLDGDGRACSGYLRLTPWELTWKSSWSTCHAASYKVQNVEDAFVLTLDDQSRERNCRIHVIEMKHPEAMPNEWSVAGYKSLDAYTKAADRPVLACLLM